MGFSLQEIVSKTKANLKEIERNMDATHGGFHPREASIYTGLKDADKAGIYETLRSVSLKELVLGLNLREYYGNRLTEFMGHSGALTTGSTGWAGAHYLIPDKIYAELFENARGPDITPLVSNIVDTPGSYLKIDVEKDRTFKPHFVGSGGEAPDETLDTTQESITPRLFNINIAVTNEMVEDAMFDTIETHVRIAGKAMGEFSTLMCLFPIMDDHSAGATTYRIEGAYNAVAAGGAYCYISDLFEAEGQNAQDGFTSDVAIIPPHGPSTTLMGESNKTWWMAQDQIAVNLASNPITNIGGMDIVRVFHQTIGLDEAARNQYYATLSVSNNWHTLVLNKTYGIQTVRKRWLKIENYSDPIKDLVGAVVSARQGHLVAYADACCVVSMH